MGCYRVVSPETCRSDHADIADLVRELHNRGMRQEQMHIRVAGTADLPALIALYGHLKDGDEQPTSSQAIEILERLGRITGSVIFIGEIGSFLAASCTLVVVPNLTRGGKPYGLIENVVTHSDFRNRGLGKLVLAAASDAARTAGCYKVMLMTGSTKPETLNFYLSAGFEQSKTGYQKRWDVG